MDFLRDYSNQSLITARVCMQSLKKTCMLPPRLVSKDFSKLPLVGICLLNSEMDLSNCFHWIYSSKPIRLKFLDFLQIVILQINLHFAGGFHLSYQNGSRHWYYHLSCNKYFTQILHWSPTWLRSCQINGFHQWKLPMPISNRGRDG